MKGDRVKKWTRMARMDAFCEIEGIIRYQRDEGSDAQTILDKIEEYSIGERRKIAKDIDKERWEQ